MDSYLSVDKQNCGRQPELDLAKAVAFILMILCHCGIYALDAGTTAYKVFDQIGAEFAAPVFMVCMGIGVVYSHHNEPGQIIKRGLRLLLGGYLLNLVRATIPEAVLSLIDPSLLIFTVQETFFMVDILQFAGCAMMLMGLLKKWRVEPAYQVLIGLLMAGLGDILGGVSTGIEYLDYICDLIWGANGCAFFPLLNWFIYPAAGVFFGEILMHCSDKDALYKRLLPIGAIGVALSYYQIETNAARYYPHNGNYYLMDIKDVVFGLCYPMLLFALCHFLNKRTRLGDNRLVLFTSKNINILYCISWVLILWLSFLVTNFAPDGWIGAALALLIAVAFAASYGLTIAYLKWKEKRASRKAQQ